MNKMKKMGMVGVACAMMLSVAACGNDASVGDSVSEAPVVSEEANALVEEEVEESAEEEPEAEEPAEEEPVEEEPVVEETPDFKVMYFIEWGSGRGLHSSFKVETDDVWSSNVDFWADYEVADGQCNINEKIGGLYYEAPIDFTRLVTGDKEDTYIMVCDQDKKFVVVYIVDEANIGNYTPWEGYDSVVNGHFAVWYTPDVDAGTAQRILDSCEVLQGEELNERFSELQGRYVPES